MESVLTLSDAKAQFSEIIEKVVICDEFIDARIGTRVVRIGHIASNAKAHKLRDPAGKM